MTEINPPGFLQNRIDHPARTLRGAVSGLISSEGIVGANDWLVTQKSGGANMSVDISGGSGYIAGTEATLQGYYYCISDASVVNLVVSAADATNPRKDLVVAQVKDSFYSGVDDEWAFAVIAGTPSATPVEPALPDNALQIAVIDVAALATSIVDANINTSRASLVVGGSSDGVAFNQRTTSYTLVLTDANKDVEINNASANTLTIPTNASVPFPIGTQVLYTQTGAGQTTITPAGGVTINSRSGLKLSGQWATALLIKRGTNTWLASGALTS